MDQQKGTEMSNVLHTYTQTVLSSLKPSIVDLTLRPLDFLV